MNRAQRWAVGTVLGLVFAATANLGDIAGSPAISPAAASAPAHSATADFGSCVAGGKPTDILLLIDESGSLATTDPDAARVTAATYLAGALAKVVDREHLQVSISVAAFASGYDPIMGWTPLGSRQLPTITAAISELRNRDQGFETDYWTALNGARKALESRGTIGSRCQAIVWFTDGQLVIGTRSTAADQKKYGLYKPFAPNVSLTTRTASAKATAAARTDLCRKAGVADSIRADDISTFAIGLGNESFTLMKGIATGSGGCGSIAQPSPGTFERVSGIDSLLFAFDTLSGPGEPSYQQQHGICQGIVSQCTQVHRFVLDPSISAVHILGTANAEHLNVSLRDPDGRIAALVNNGVGQPESILLDGIQVRYAWDSANTLEIDMSAQQPDTAWRGQWQLAFTDPTSSSPNGVSRSEIHLSTDIKAVWPEAGNTTLRAGQSVRDVRFVLQDRTGTSHPASSLLGTVELSAILLDASGNEISTVASDLDKAHLGDPQTIDLSNVQPGTVQLRLSLTLTTASVRSNNGATIPGTMLTPQRVNIPLTVLPPLDYPSVYGGVDFGSITGSANQVGQLTVTGPGCVWIGDTDQPDIQAEPSRAGKVRLSSTASSETNCSHIAAGQSAQVPILLTSAHAGNGPLKGTFNVSTRPNANGPTVIVTVPFRAQLRLNLNAFHFWTALLAAIILGIGLPAILLLLAKWFEARIPGRTLFAERFVISLSSGEVRRDGEVLALRESDFVNSHVPITHSQRAVDVAGVRLQAHISLPPGMPGYVTVVSQGLVGASSERSKPSVSRELRARLPLAVHNHWIVLHDPSGPADRAELLVFVSGDAGREQRENLIADARRRAAQSVNALRAQARRIGLVASAAEPALRSSGGPGAPPPDALLDTGFAPLGMVPPPSDTAFRAPGDVSPPPGAGLPSSGNMLPPPDINFPPSDYGH